MRGPGRSVTISLAEIGPDLVQEELRFVITLLLLAILPVGLLFWAWLRLLPSKSR